MLEFLEAFSVAKDPEIEQLLRSRPIYRQRAANPHIVDTTEAVGCGKTAPEKIPVGKVSRTLQPKQHYVDDLPERASAACLLDELREKATEIRKIGTRIRKNASAGANTIAQNLSASIHFQFPFLIC